MLAQLVSAQIVQDLFLQYEDLFSCLLWLQPEQLRYIMVNEIDLKQRSDHLMASQFHRASYLQCIPPRKICFSHCILWPITSMLKLIIDFDCENYGQRPSSCTISKYFEGLMTVDVSSDSNCGPNVKFAFDALG